ncbi:MAG: hypothetical protein ABGW77_02725 [Campylobacterales bacterium]
MRVIIYLHPSIHNEIQSLSKQEISRILYIHNQIEKNGFKGIETEKIRQDKIKIFP